MTTVRKEPESADASIEALLREVGARDEPSSEATRDVMSAVHAEWRTLVKQRRRQQRVVAWRIAASLMLAILISTFAYRYFGPAAVPIATIVNVDGHLQVAAADASSEARATGQVVSVGETVQTDAQSRAALTLPGGVSVRLDHDTRMTIAAADRIELTSGALYIDAPLGNPKADSLTVETIAGSVRHVGTQYEVRTRADSMRVSVREGRVLVTSPTSSSSTGEAGHVLQLTANGELTRSSLAATDPYWQWALEAGPTFDIDNQSLADFLEWIARETGRHVVYSTPQAAAAAATVKLRGSIAGLETDAALRAVLSTTQLRRYRTDDSEIGIELAAIDSSAMTRPTR